MQVLPTNFQYTSPLIRLDLDKVQYIIIHHPDAITASPEDIHQWHLANGWAGFGYNEYIRKDGTVYIGRGDSIGAQCEGMNSKSYGICCEGNYDIETEMPDVQLRSLRERISYHTPRFKNFRCVAPHSQFYNTSCPGVNFPMSKILNEEVKTMTAQEAMKILVDKGVVASPDYWNKVLDTVKNFDQLLINFATVLTK